MADLSSISDANGFIKISALDHRGSLKKILSEDKLDDFKALCVETFAPYTTATLLDPLYGVKGIEIAQTHKIGILLAREETGYADNAGIRDTKLLEEYPSDRLKEMGATAIKLLLYYNSDASNRDNQRRIAEKVRDEAKISGLPFLLEIVTYSVEGYPYHKGDATIRAIHDLQEFADILKLEFPTAEEAQLRPSIPYIMQMTAECDQKPWILLSRGMQFDLYKNALILSKENGASGFAVGRAVWQEFANYQSWDEQVNFIKTTSVKRMKELSEIFSGKEKKPEAQGLLEVDPLEV